LPTWSCKPGASVPAKDAARTKVQGIEGGNRWHGYKAEAGGGCFNAGSYLYFERSVLAAMHAAGRRAASAWLAAGPRADRRGEMATGAAA